MNTPASRQNTSSARVDYEGVFVHYRDLLWRWKVYIAVVVPVVGLLTLVGGLIFMPSQPNLTATATVGLDDISLVSASKDGRIEILSSRGFMRDIANQLSLRLNIHTYPRAAIVDSCWADSGAVPGRYDVTFDPKAAQSYVVQFTNSALGAKHRQLDTGSVELGGALSLRGVYLRWSELFAESPHNFSFTILPDKYVIKYLLDRCVVTPPNPEERREYLTIALAGADYDLVATIANTIAEKFVERNLDARARRGRGTLLALKRQLDEADANRQASERALRAFLSANPDAGLTMTAQQSMGTLAAQQSDKASLENTISEGQRLSGAFQSATGDAREQLAQEILVFLATNREARASVLLSDLNRLLTEGSTSLRDYSADHPQVVQNRRGRDILVGQAADALQTWIARSQHTVNSADGAIRSLSSKLNSLPNKERQLAELQNRQQVDAQLYTTVLARYNDAKVASADESPGVYVLDLAVPPMPPGRLILLLQLFAVALGLSLVVGLGPAFVRDYFDRTAHTAWDLKRLSNRPLIQAIPDLTALKRRERSTTATTQAEPALPDVFSQGYVGELFRSLRTKTMLSLHQQPHKTVVFTSLAMGDGKTTVASHLAVALARQGLRTLLLDADLRRGAVHQAFGLTLSPGTSELLNDEQPLTKDLIRSVLRSGGAPNLTIVTAGAAPENPVELLASPRLRSVHDIFKKLFDVIIIDTPPLSIGADAVVLHDVAARYMGVLRAGHTNITHLEQKIDEYPVLAKAFFGYILNRASIEYEHSYERYVRYYRAPHEHAR